MKIKLFKLSITNSKFYTLIFLIIMLLISVPVFADEKESTCDMQYKVAKLVMTMRQYEKSPSDIRKEVGKIFKYDKDQVKLLSIMTDIAFIEPLYYTKSNKDAASSKFAGMLYNACVDSYK